MEKKKKKKEKKKKEVPVPSAQEPKTKRKLQRRSPAARSGDAIRVSAKDGESSYRPICLLDTMGKLLEEMILQRLQGHMVHENGLSENQFGFRKGRSTVDAIQAVVDIATKARRRTGKRNYLLRMIDDYLSDRWVICEGDKWSLKKEMTCGAPQGSQVGPLVWNVMYDDFLRMDLPAGTSIIGFADDALVVCAADDVRILELRINESLWLTKRWLDSRCLKMAPEKTEALLVTDRRSFQYPKIVLGEHEIEWRKSIKYLGVQLDQRLSFGEHLQIATAKAI